MNFHVVSARKGQAGVTIAQAFIEMESGKHDDDKRPESKTAPEAARKGTGLG